MSQLRVLVVEDEQMMVEIIERVLVRKFAALVDLAGNGREGLQQAAEQTYSLILSDIRMPEMDGISMLEHIRTGSGPNRTTPVIWISRPYSAIPPTTRATSATTACNPGSASQSVSHLCPCKICPCKITRAKSICSVRGLLFSNQNIVEHTYNQEFKVDY